MDKVILEFWVIFCFKNGVYAYVNIKDSKRITENCTPDEVPPFRNSSLAFACPIILKSFY
jgi:hypothetical protein